MDQFVFGLYGCKKESNENVITLELFFAVYFHCHHHHHLMAEDHLNFDPHLLKQPQSVPPPKTVALWLPKDAMPNILVRTRQLQSPTPNKLQMYNIYLKGINILVS